MSFPPPTLRSDRIPALDGFRGIAVLLVLVTHCIVEFLACTPASPKPLVMAHIYSEWLLRYSWGGVDMFFVLSGFLVGGIILDRRRQPGFLPEFFVRRAARILPLYLAVVAGWALAWATQSAPPGTTHSPAWPYLSFLQNAWMARHHTMGDTWLAPTWSLAVEAHFYLVAPFVAIRLRDGALGGVAIFTLVVAMFLRVAFEAGLAGGLLAGYVLTPSHMDGMIYGFLLAYALRQPGFSGWVQGQRGWLRGTVLIMTLGFLALSTLRGRTGMNLAWSFEVGSLPLFFTGLLLLTVTSHGLTAKAFANPLLRLFGRYSYGIYLLHLPFILLTMHRLPSAAVEGSTWAEVRQMSLGLALALAAAVLSWHTFEAPILRWAHRFRSPPRPAGEMPLESAR